MHKCRRLSMTPEELLIRTRCRIALVMAILAHLGSRRTGALARTTGLADQVVSLLPARHLNLSFRWATT